MSQRAEMKSSWADESDDDSKSAPPNEGWKGWGSLKKPEPVDLRKPSQSDVDYPSLNGGGPRRSSSQQPSRNGHEAPRRNDSPPRGPRGGDDRRDTYSAPRGGDNYGRDSYNDRPRGGDSYNDRPRGGDNYGRDDRRDSYNNDRRDSYNDRRDSYNDRPRGDYGRDSYDNKRDGYGDRRDSYDNRRDDRRDSYSNRRDNYGERDGEERSDSQDWRDKPARDDGERRDYGRDSYRGDRGDRNRDYNNRPQREPRPKLPLPTKPPFIAFVGNLDFNLQEEDIMEFFQCDCEVKIVTFPDTQKPRGYGYVTFKELAELEAALAKDGQELHGRSVKVDVSEGPRERRESSSHWGRDKESRFENRDRNFDRGGDRADRGDRDDESPREREAPVERPKLVLAPKTRKDDEPATPTSPTATSGDDAKSPPSSASKANPFGAAKPRDELAAQRAVEERRAEREKAEKEKAEKERAEKEQENKDKPASTENTQEKEKEEGGAPRRPQGVWGGDRDKERSNRGDQRRDDRAPISGVNAPRGGERREYNNRDNRDSRDSRDNRDNRDHRDNRDSRDHRDNRDNRPRDFNRDNRDDHRDSHDHRDNRDNRGDRDNRGRAPERRNEGAPNKAPQAPTKEASKDNKPKPAPAVKPQEKKGAKEVANQFAVLNISETECP